MKYRGKRAPAPEVACDLMFDFALIFGPDVMLKNQGQFWVLRLLTVRVRITVRVGVGLRLESGLE